MKRSIIFLLVTSITTSIWADESAVEALRHPYDGFTRPYRTIQVAAGEAGRVAEVLVRPGDRVQRGQTLLELDTDVLQVRRRRAAADAESTTEVEKLQIEAMLAGRRLKNLQALGGTGGSTVEEVLRADANSKIAGLSLQRARQERSRMQINLEEIEAQIQARHVTSPMTGVVTDVRWEPGEFVHPSAPEVATVVDLQQLRVTYFLPTADTVNLFAGLQLPLRLPETGQTVAATIERKGVVTEANSGRVRLELIIDNRHNKYRSGVRCVLSNSPASVPVPSDSRPDRIAGRPVPGKSAGRVRPERRL